MWKNISIVSSVAAIMLAGVSIAAAQTSATSGQQQPQTAQQRSATEQPNAPNEQNRHNATEQNEHAFLGVQFEPVPRAVASQLATAFPQIARGVLIREVLPNSPAAEAGIKPDDIVTEVDNKPIRSADHLMVMVERDHPGQKLALQVVRDSKAENLNVTLGERPNQGIIRGQEPENGRESAAVNEPNNQESAGNAEEELESFDSMSLQRTGKDQYKAEISFRDKQGKIDSRSFQGSREQINKDITSQTDLPRSERHQLLGALRLPVELGLQNAPQSNGVEQNAPQTNNRPENQKSSR